MPRRLTPRINLSLSGLISPSYRGCKSRREQAYCLLVEKDRQTSRLVLTRHQSRGLELDLSKIHHSSTRAARWHPLVPMTASLFWSVADWIRRSKYIRPVQSLFDRASGTFPTWTHSSRRPLEKRKANFKRVECEWQKREERPVFKCIFAKKIRVGLILRQWNWKDTALELILLIVSWLGLHINSLSVKSQPLMVCRLILIIPWNKI